MKPELYGWGNLNLGGKEYFCETYKILLFLVSVIKHFQKCDVQKDNLLLLHSKLGQKLINNKCTNFS